MLSRLIVVQVSISLRELHFFCFVSLYGTLAGGHSGLTPEKNVETKKFA